MKILYSFNKTGFEASYWKKEISAASNKEVVFIPFNHGEYLEPHAYIRAQLLDNLYFENNPNLYKLYNDIEELIKLEKIDAILVDNCPPYHPEFLKKLQIYKVLRIADGPIAAYDRDFAYLHAYNHILYHSPAYSRDLDMPEKLKYCKAENFDFWPLGSFDTMCDTSLTEENLFDHQRDIDIVFVGALHLNKMPFIAAIKKAFGKKIKLFGLSSFKKNVYFNLKYGFPGWIRPLPFENYVKTYRRAKIGINIHNRGKFTTGNYRMFDLAANGVMQISDGDSFLSKFFDVGNEIVGYSSLQDLIEKVDFYLDNKQERNRIALNSFRRVKKEYKIRTLLEKAARIIANQLPRQMKDS